LVSKTKCQGLQQTPKISPGESVSLPQPQAHCPKIKHIKTQWMIEMDQQIYIYIYAYIYTYMYDWKNYDTLQQYMHTQLWLKLNLRTPIIYLLAGPYLISVLCPYHEYSEALLYSNSGFMSSELLYFRIQHNKVTVLFLPKQCTQYYARLPCKLI
jgi:hypothetical protein